jgi:hypothetical protein
MIQTPTKTDALVEVFPVITDNLPSLTTWKLDAPSEQWTLLGQKLAHRLRLRQGSHWIWAQDRLITDATLKQEDLMEFLKSLWSDDDEAFKVIRSLTFDREFTPLVQTLADFVAFGVATDLDKRIRDLLRNHRTVIRNANVERDYEVQGWDINGWPAVSITVFSHIIASITLPQYIKTQVQDTNDIIGLMVKDRTSNLRGEITQIVGTVVDHRETLMARASREVMKKLIDTAPDNDLVLHIKSSNQKSYDYPASTLSIIASPAQYNRLGIDGREALSALQIQPAPRYNWITEIAKFFGQLGYINEEPLSFSNSPGHFDMNLDTQLGIKAKLGDGFTCECNPQTVLNALRKHPPFQRAPKLPAETPIRIAVLNLIGQKEQIQHYLAEIRKQLNEIYFRVDFVGAERPSAQSYREIDVAIDKLAQNAPHIVITFVPGDPGDGETDSDLYLQLKTQMLEKDIQSQVIYERTLDNNYAVNNIILGILAKTGNVPYVLDKPLPYADLLVGIDIARTRNQRRSGSRSMAAMTRIYAANGDFLKFNIVDAPVEGETLTLEIIRKLFPAKEFTGKRCVVHRDGIFRGQEKDYFKTWGAEINTAFYLVEVVKSRVPRLYKRDASRIIRPDKGTVFFVDSRQAFLVSSLPPSKNSTPRPLSIRTDEDFPIQNAVHSVLALTHLHFGSVAMPRLPVTLHYSDQIGYLILRGVRPRTSEGTQPFWI